MSNAGTARGTRGSDAGRPVHITLIMAIKKKVHPERVLESMGVAKSLGINIKANLMIGFSDETRRDLWQTIRFGLQAAWIGVDDIPSFPSLPIRGRRSTRSSAATARCHHPPTTTCPV